MPEPMNDSDETIRHVLDHVGRDLDPSILIGGWATHLRVGGEISHDIDLIVTPSSRYLLDSVVENLTDNSVHQTRKFRGEVEGVHLDIYVPHESQLGARLKLKVEALAEYVDADIAPPWLLLTIDAHFVTKLAALFDRFRSEKGTKDAREILALLKEGVDPGSRASDPGRGDRRPTGGHPRIRRRDVPPHPAARQAVQGRPEGDDAMASRVDPGGTGVRVSADACSAHAVSTSTGHCAPKSAGGAR